MEVELQHASEPQQPVRTLWFEDGNLVIQAGNSQYRVYRGFLATRSSVFEDMLSFPQPPDSELVDGCPLVHLPDPEVEVTPFLKALFEPEFFMPFPAGTTFDAVVGCLRLSHKYGVDYLHRRALSWQVPEDQIYTVCAIQLAREVDAPRILPRAFYTLGEYFNELGIALFNGAVYRGVETRLSVQDQKSFSKGLAIQSTTAAVDILRFLSHPLDIPGCDDPGHCHSTRLQAVDWSRTFIRDYPFSVLYIWASEDWGLLEYLCTTCLEALRKTHQDARQAFWDKLPEMYDLPPWTELEQMKTKAIGPSPFG
ncbi:hypothetical protein MVEN_01077100 [Mycena venus]|uniref:BTB domain-containing protein n=1 Tax=Mycena venus TaxID=2733690 RepID=A0A8H6Y4A1_9AGAR|nr:hypothetical protein MVEN_01077100 [Mycena venus]